MISTTAASANKFVQTTNQLHRSEKLNYVDGGVDATLNLYKISATVDNGKKIYSPLNIQFTSTSSLTLKERRALKKMKFFQHRRPRQLQRKLKKMKFYQERRRKKFHNKIYLWKWFQNKQIKTSRLEIS